MIEKIYYYLNFKLIAFRFRLLKNKLKSCGLNVSIDDKAVILGCENICIGSDVSINAFVHIWGHGGVEIGNGSLIASHCSLTSLTHNPSVVPYKDEVVSKKIVIGKNVWIGSHSVIMPGITIGDNAIIGAGSIVTKDIPNNYIVSGVPAKLMRINT